LVLASNCGITLFEASRTFDLVAHPRRNLPCARMLDLQGTRMATPNAKSKEPTHEGIDE
jgi:hypothetical protein